MQDYVLKQKENKMLKHVLLFLFGIFLIGCSFKPVNVYKLKLKGSDTMYMLTSILAEEYMKTDPSVSIYVEGGGTVSGVKALISGEVNICTASRPLEADEVKLIAEHFGTVGMSFLIAKDALSIYINPDNPVKNITVEELKKIFTGKIINWNELGGNNEPILPIIRMPNSGTYLYFKEHILEGEEYLEPVRIKPSLSGVIDEIRNKRNAIGYGGIGFKEEIEHALINGIEPSEDNVRNDKYPIQRYLYFYTINNPTGKVKEFIDWVVSPAGQKIITKAGYISLWNFSY